ncbi:hypothetical protein KFU94_53905 [Chloroflexi bacterium TSY]|nr:hypothetical protein [Chloroflexi bacterium TSY]
MTSLSRLKRLRHYSIIVLMLLVALLLIGRNGYTAPELRNRAIGTTVTGHLFDFVAWEVRAIREKIGAFFSQPGAEFNGEAGTMLVRDYLERARRMGSLERQLNAILAGQSANERETAETDTTPDAEILQREWEELRIQQQTDRPAVEQVIQQLVASEIISAGVTVAGRPFPPVLFTFSEPPKKMVVSPRDRIETIHGRMLDPEIDLATIERAEETIYDEQDLSAYITNIGGLGAFPTMVVDRASLAWVLSTVAHEWTHNYLTFFPLGFNYATSSEFVIMNESVAEIVGNEVGDRVLARYFPDLVPLPPTTVPAQDASSEHHANDESVDELPLDEEPPFDFRTEMRTTRLEVDRLLAEGKIDEAEAYMEERRLLFVENGYPLRVLNQAYFAFHGSYVTSPAASDPIGPKMEQLREQLPDLLTFLQTVRSFTSAADIDRAIAETLSE